MEPMPDCMSRQPLCGACTPENCAGILVKLVWNLLALRRPCGQADNARRHRRCCSRSEAAISGGAFSPVQSLIRGGLASLKSNFLAFQHASAGNGVIDLSGIALADLSSVLLRRARRASQRIREISPYSTHNLW